MKIVKLQSGLLWFKLPGKEVIEMRGITQDDLDNRFAYHAPKDDQAERYGAIRSAAKKFAALVISQTPTSREQTRAINKIDEAVFLANASIARNE